MPTEQTFSPLVPAVGQGPLQSGRYYFAPNFTASATLASMGTGTLHVLPWSVPNTVTLSRIGAEVTIIGDVGSKVRLGIYNDDGTGRPGTLLLDAGTIAGDSATVQEIVISQLVPTGLYWIGGAVQIVTVTQPTCRVSASGPIFPVDVGTVIPTAGLQSPGYQVTGVAGALPTPFGAPSTTSNGFRVFVKVA
jgi:hypothetical protein